MILKFLRLYSMLKKRSGLNNAMGLLNSELYRNDIKKALEKYDFRSFDGKKVLVTGAAGLICSSLIDVLLFWHHTRFSLARSYPAVGQCLAHRRGICR